MGKPLIAVAVVALCSMIACGGPSTTTTTPPASKLFRKGPYILLGEPGAAFIAVEVFAAEAPVVEWWPAETSRAEAQSVTAQADGNLWVAELTGLPVEGEVEYRIRTTAGTSKTYRFRSGVGWGESFRFAVIGDTHSGEGIHGELVAGMVRDEPDFLIHIGDMVAAPDEQQSWQQFFATEAALFAETPIFPVMGHHDRGDTGLYEHYWQLDRWAYGQPHYVRDLGHVRLAVATADLACTGSTCPEVGFFRHSLNEAAESGMMSILAVHQAPYSSGAHGSYLEMRDSVAQLAGPAGVELVLSGHDHDYERTKPIDGVTYVVTGSGGAPTRPVRDKIPESAVVRVDSHYLLIDVEADRMILRATNLTGDTFDTHIINPVGSSVSPRTRTIEAPE